jgi:hypothetical protein
LTIEAFGGTGLGHVSGEVRGFDPAGARNARAAKPLSNTDLSPVVYVSFDVTHNGGFLGYGGSGYCRSQLWMLNGSGAGYGLRVGLAKGDAMGLLLLYHTSDWGQTYEERGGVNFSWDHGPEDQADWWKEYRVAAEWNRTTRQIELFFDGGSMHTISLEPAEHDAVMDFTTVVLNPRDTFTGDLESGSGYLSTDDIWIGDEPDPTGPDPLPQKGDTNGDGWVDIVDLAALVGRWYSKPNGWGQGNFDYGTWDDPQTWSTDIEDLTALAGNWTGAPPGGAEIPEPTGIALLTGGLLVLLRRR